MSAVVAAAAVVVAAGGAVQAPAAAPVVVHLGFTMLLTSQVIRVSFYSEHENSDKFWLEVLLLAINLRQDPWLYISSEGSYAGVLC